MNQHPHITPYRSIERLLELREWFFETSPVDRRRDAIARVEAFSTKGQLAHSIESTSMITDIILRDEAGQDEEKTDEVVLRMAYTMAIIRFVNGLLDPYQQSNFAVPLHTLAKFLKLPSLFVELRHCGTHEFLPSLEMLRSTSKKALEWLYEHYWLEIDSKQTQARQQQLQLEKIEELNRMTEEIKTNCKNYKKIRKLNLSKIYKFGDSTEAGVKYWTIVTNLKKLYDQDNNHFITVLLSNKILILPFELNGAKTKGLRVLYRPLFEELGPDFVLALFTRLVDCCVTEIQAFNWCTYILSNEMIFKDQRKLINEDHADALITALTKRNCTQNIELLQLLAKGNLSPSFKQQIAEKLNFMNKFLIDAAPSVVDNPASKKRDTRDGDDNDDGDDDDEIARDLANLKKRMKLQKAKNQKKDNNVILWETKHDWTPTAFGVPI